ncbi:MAG: hypothetical protein J6038_02995, partial [Bacilli bacterium]|nr:hypothetical protein [Bacilli bacterium]
MDGKKTYAVFFVEGKTEAVFYRLLTDYLAQKSQLEHFPILKFVDLKGENNFAQKLNAKSLSLYIQKHPADSYTFFFCYDHDLFPNEPPIDWEKVKKGLPSQNVEAFFVSPVEQIEDWFFLDSESLLNSLRLGFANLALNKKTNEVRKILQAVKTQYSKLDELIDTTQKR